MFEHVAGNPMFVETESFAVAFSEVGENIVVIVSVDRLEEIALTFLELVSINGFL